MEQNMEHDIEAADFTGFIDLPLSDKEVTEQKIE